MTAPDDDFPKTPRCWKCSAWGEGIISYRLHPAHRLRWKCEDKKRCDANIERTLMLSRVGII